MKYVFSSKEKLGDIVVKMPKAVEVFKAYEIDFCCGGSRSLIEAIKEHNLKEEEVLEKLQVAYEEVKDLKDESIDWTKAPLSSLVDYVVNTHHAYLVQELPKLSQLTTKILRVHGEDHGNVLSPVHKLFHTLKMELEQHLIKEEEIVFPLIKEYEANPSSELLDKTLKTINELESEHDEVGNILREIRKVTDGYTVPSDGCYSYDLTFKGLELLEGDTFQHVHLENNILFSRLETMKK